jgi:predicted amidohydrolase
VSGGVVRAAALRIAPVLGDGAANRRIALAAIERAAADGARLVVLPELATSGYCFGDRAEARAAAEPVPGPSTRAWQEAAAAHDLVVVGGVCEDEAGVLRNSAVVVDGHGVRAVYRKIHLWGGERAIFAEGAEPPPVVDTAVGRIGLAICYDLWFPELVGGLARRGAEIVAAPSNLSATPAQPGLPHLDVLVAIAAAHLNRVNLVLADRCGDERGERWLGAALIVDADGTLLAGPPPGAEPACVSADLRPAAARDKSWGPHNDLLADRRPQTYDGR